MTTTANVPIDDSDDELEELLLVDYDVLTDEQVDYGDDYSDSDDDDYVPTRG